MLNMYIHQGRRTPDESLGDWGPDGPTLSGITGLHQTYGGAANVYFTARAAMLEAQRLTGWEECDNNGLTMRWQDDCVVVDEPGKPRMFYGDWGLARVATMTAAEAESILGPRGALTVTTENRATVRKWLVAHGIPSLWVGGLTMRVLAAAYNELDGNVLERLRVQAAEASAESDYPPAEALS
jgi:hypothetical protein